MNENPESGSIGLTGQPEQIDIVRLLRSVLRSLRKLWWLIVVLAVLGGGVLALREVRSYTPMYQSRASFTVELISTSGSSYSYYYNSSTASQMASTFPYILESDLLTDLVKDELGTSYINGTISASSVADTNLFVLTVTSSSAQDAYDILQAVMNHYSEVSDYIIGSTQLSLIEEPTVADAPYNSTDVPRAAAKGAVLGIAAALLLILLYSFTRVTICSESEIRDVLNVKSLGSLPRVLFKKHRRGDEQQLRLTNDLVPESYRESVRSCVLQMEQDFRKNQRKVILFTSSVPGEGVTSAAENTACALAEMSNRVLLVDADLRGGRTHRTDVRAGLDDLLTGHASADEALWRDPDEHFRRLFCRKGLTEREILRSTMRIGEVIRFYADRMDYVLIDAPSCADLSHAALFLRHADAVVFIVKYDGEPARRIADCIDEVSCYGAAFAGCILNGAQETGSHSYGYGYRYGKYGGYSYRYGGRYGSYYGGHYGSRYGVQYGSRYGYGYGYDAEEKKSGGLFDRKKGTAKQADAEAAAEQAEAKPDGK